MPPRRDKPSTPEWREFEKLISRIEQALSPLGITVKSPDHILDRNTGRPREVDVSIKHYIGSTPILITVECRDRHGTEDVTWIEQLATKKAAIGAAKTIAVSSSGFSDPAIRAAESYGIEIRQIKKITPDEIKGWLQIKAIQKDIYHAVLEGSLGLELDAPEGITGETPEFDASVQQLLDSDAVNAPIFIRKSDGKTFTINDIVFCSEQRGDFAKILNHNIPEDGTRIRRPLKINFKPGDFHVWTISGPCNLVSISLAFDIYRDREEIPLDTDSMFVYSDANRPILYVSPEYEIEVQGQSVNLSFYQDPNSRIFQVDLKVNHPSSSLD